jgi:hypothetical protein
MTNFPIIGLFVIDVMTSSTGGEHRVRLWLDSRPSPKVENSMSKLVKFLAAASVFAAVSGVAHADTSDLQSRQH